jgi:hypothetical protein
MQMKPGALLLVASLSITIAATSFSTPALAVAPMSPADFKALLATKAKTATRLAETKKAKDALFTQGQTLLAWKKKHDANQCTVPPGPCDAYIAEAAQIDRADAKLLAEVTANEASLATQSGQLGLETQRISATKALMLARFPDCAGLSDEAAADCFIAAYHGGAKHVPLRATGTGTHFFGSPNVFGIATGGNPALVKLDKQFSVLESQRQSLQARLAGMTSNSVERAALKQQILNLEYKEHLLQLQGRKIHP